MIIFFYILGILSNKLNNVLGISKDDSQNNPLSPSKIRHNTAFNNHEKNDLVHTSSSGIIKPINKSRLDYKERSKIILL